MKISHTQSWADEWSICIEDRNLSQKLIPIFEFYLQDLQEKGVSKTTFNRHKNGCHSLGGYIVAEVFGYENYQFIGNESGKDILLNHIGADGGPLIHHDNELWQREIDVTCKKLFKFLSNDSI